MCTGIFFHYQEGERLKDFPEALGGLLNRNNVFFFDAYYPSQSDSSIDIKPVPADLLHKVHTPEVVERVKASGHYDGALFSASGTLSAAIKISTGELKNAFIFTGYGDHHAGKDFFGGGCYFNGTAIAIHELRRRCDVKRFAIIDTDAHHGDGMWSLFQEDPDVLYVCFCTQTAHVSHRKVNIQVPSPVADDFYLELAMSAFAMWVEVFEPELIFWNWGYDGTIGEYGDMGLTPKIHPRLALEVKKLSEEVSNGRLIVVLCGGRDRKLAASIIPGIIEILADEWKQEV